jgi:hypothetical protein
MTRKRWSHSAGAWGRNRVRAFERGPGTIYVTFYERDGDRLVKRKYSLGHADRELARRHVEELAVAYGRAQMRPAVDLTLEALFDNYLREVSAGKSRATQQHDQGCASIFSGPSAARGRRAASISATGIGSFGGGGRGRSAPIRKSTTVRSGIDRSSTI